MTPNSFPDKALREVQVRELLPESRQGIDTADVADGSLQENIQKVAPISTRLLLTLTWTRGCSRAH